MKTKPKTKSVPHKKAKKEHSVTHWNGAAWLWCAPPYPDSVNELLASGKTGEIETGDGKFRVQ